MPVYDTMECDFTDSAIHRAVIARCERQVGVEMYRARLIVRALPLSNPRFVVTMEPLLIHHLDKADSLLTVIAAHTHALAGE